MKYKTYLLAVKKGGHWLFPGMRVRCSYGEACERLKGYIERSGAQEGWVAEPNGKILLRLRPHTKTVITFKLLEGEWP